MSKATILFNILSYWHTGSGHSGGAKLDAKMVRTPAGLPYIPGKTVKGLLREAVKIAEEHEQIKNKLTEQLFGRRENITRFDTEPSILTFTDATLGHEMEDWATINKEKLKMLFKEISATAINENGIAYDNSLRTIEVAIPVTLKAEVTLNENNNIPWKEVLEILLTATPLVRSFGSHRHRGLGRVELKVEEVINE
jgi:CRISPR/Cas system CSM-associated protein Csm3 (group 7 of RAMP superfamily)